MSPVPTVLEPYARRLVHDPAAFDGPTMSAHALNFRHMGTLEPFAWDLEVLSQLERRSPPDHLTFAGGGCTQLYLPIEIQRASVDLDIYFFNGDEKASRSEWQKVVASFNAELGDIVPGYFALVEAPPTRPPKVHLPMLRYEVICPTTTGQTVMADGRKGCRIVVEVIFTAPPSAVPIGPRGVLPFDTGEHQGLRPTALIASKLLALSVGEIGIPGHRLEELAKHVHDIARLQAVAIAAVADLEETRAFLDTVLEMENRWHKPQSSLVSCRASVGTVMALLETGFMQNSISDFENNNLRQRLPDEDWQIWPRLVRLLFSAVAGPHNRSEFLEGRRAAGLLETSRLSAPQQRVALQRSLLEALAEADFGTTAALREKRLEPAPLFLELVFRARLDEAVRPVQKVLGPEWPGFALTPIVRPS